MDEGYIWLEERFQEATDYFLKDGGRRPKHSYLQTEYTLMFRPLAFSPGNSDFFSLKKDVERPLGERSTADPSVYYVCRFGQSIEVQMRKLFNREHGYIQNYIEEDLMERVSCP